jgi:hypothetical protein
MTYRLMMAILGGRASLARQPAVLAGKGLAVLSAIYL